MPVVRIEMFEGRTEEQKKDLVESITREMERVIGCDPQQLYIIFEDVKKANWGLGGKLCSELIPD